jgi:hypothetical protein
MIEPVRGEAGMWKLTHMLNAHYRETEQGDRFIVRNPERILN